MLLQYKTTMFPSIRLIYDKPRNPQIQLGMLNSIFSAFLRINSFFKTTISSVLASTEAISKICITFCFIFSLFPIQVNAACLPAGPFNGAANNITCNPGVNETFDTLGGNDIVTVNAGTVGDVSMSTGQDIFILNNGTVNSVSQGSGNDIGTIINGVLVTISQDSGIDTLTVDGGTITTINQGTGRDTLTLNGGSITNIFQGSSSDTLTMNGGIITGIIDQGSFADILTISGGNINTINQGTGNDSLTISGATTGAIIQGDGLDSFTMGVGTVIDSLDQGGGIDTATLNGGHIIGLFDNGDIVNFHAGRIGDVDLKKADNIFIMDGALGAVSIDGFLTAQNGKDTYTLTSGTIGGNVNSGNGDDVVLIDGTAITGILETRGGNDIITLASGSVTGAILAGDNDDTFTWSGGTLTSFNAGNGSDNALVTAINFDGSQNLDGGDDISIADGFIDTLTINGVTATINAGNISNWENIIIDGGTLSFANGLLATGSDAGTGLTLQNGGTLDAAGGFALTGNINNGGIITSQNNVVGDIISVSGNYTGNGGQLLIDTVLGDDASITDLLTINGNTSGATTVTVQNVGGTGAQTNNGIEIIQVTGASAGNFILNGDYVTSSSKQAVIGGAFGYTLEQQADGDWALLSQLRQNGIISPLYQPATPIYEALPINLLTLADLPTLQQRVGNRNWAEATRNQSSQRPYGGWSRINIGSRAIDSDRSTTSLNSNTQYGEIQIGFDIPIHTTENNQVIVGINGSYGSAKSNVHSRFGNGDISSDSYNIGTTATWYGNKGGYVDGQFKYSFINTDLHSNKLNRLKNIDANGLSASLEIGKQLNISPKHKLSITPQVQLTYSTVGFDSFTGRYKERVSMKDNDRLKGRLGVTLDQQLSSDSEPSQHIYVIANIIHEFKQTTSVKVSRTKLKNRTDQNFAELGIGGTYNWNKNRYSVYGEIKGETSLEHIGHSKSFAATVGFRMNF